MNEEKDNWEELKNLPDDYEYDASIAQRAIERIQQEKARKSNKEGWWRKHWRPMAVSLATCAVIVGVGIPIYHSLFNPNIEVPPDNSSTVYYEEKQLTINPVDNVTTYLQEMQVNIKYFNYPTAETHSAVVNETNEFAYLKQEMLYIGADGFDQVKLWSEVLTSADFDFEYSFEGITQSITVNNLAVSYRMEEEIADKNKEIKAKFTYESVNYYLEIVTAGETETKIEQYVNLLIG